MEAEQPAFAFDDEDTGTSYDSSEFEDAEADAAMADNEAAAALLRGMTTPAEKPPEADEGLDLDYMSDVDRRLSIANCYRELLDGPLFEQGSESTAVVEREIRHFVVQRLGVLMGARSDGQPTVIAAKPQFSDVEAQALKGAATAFQAGGDVLRALAGLSAREIQALKTLAAVALRQKGLVPAAPRAPAPAPAAAPLPVRPTVRKKPGPAAPVPAPTPAPAAKVVRRGRAPAPPATEKKVARETPGGVHETTVPRVQRPKGMVPFPTDNRSMEVASMQIAGAQSVTQMQNADNESKTTGAF